MGGSGGGGGDVEGPQLQQTQNRRRHHHQHNHQAIEGVEDEEEAAVEEVNLVSIFFFCFGKVFKCCKYCHTMAYDNNDWFDLKVKCVTLDSPHSLLADD